MSVTSIPETVKLRLWGKAAGRCEYDGCLEPLWLDPLTKVEFNNAYIAHIVADQPDGPRGDKKRSKVLSKKLSNLMLMCDRHHRLIDKEDVSGHPESRLVAMKRQHESRMELLTSIAADRKSHVVLYGANIGMQGAPLSYSDAAEALTPEFYPSSYQPTTIGLANSAIVDADPSYWDLELRQLTRKLDQLVPQVASGEIGHLSIFAIAPQPLLVALGAKLSDLPRVEVYQRRREPATWRWSSVPKSQKYKVERPPPSPGDAALVLSISADVAPTRAFEALGRTVPVWKISVPRPGNDVIRSRAQTQAFRVTMRALLNEMKLNHGEKATIHVFPAMPVSLAVELGRVWNMKADLPLAIYDQNRQLGGFKLAVSLPHAKVAP